MSDGWQFDPVRVMNAIDRYIDDWFSERIADPVLTRRMEEDAERKQREATRTPGRLWKHG